MRTIRYRRFSQTWGCYPKLTILSVPLVVTILAGGLAAQPPAKAKAKAEAKARPRAEAKVQPPPPWYKAPPKRPLDERDPDTWPEYHVSDPAYYNREYAHDPRPGPPAWYAAYRALLRAKPVPPERVDHYAPLDRETGDRFYRHPGWWLTIRDVRAREDGSLLIRVNAVVTISSNHAPPHVGPQFLESYTLAPDGTLSFVGGEPLGWPSPDGKAHLSYQGKPQ